ncbi:hypothetical protein JR316_0007880 [Psilocybe cubensis]|uniref:C3H1-type domain-containing protein n=2 Tax=Psilocybe cubensis TaxID=181762 RepID=A0A8H7XUM8_PSICU|nr:hypothetical protein JR316_0007880 [Psilocybe cubensis]KAH9479292.1 hypothetical protein JR316_0007880 [Psilocybe cubensis]
MQAPSRTPDHNLNTRHIRTQDKVCHHWLQGKCRFGSTCKFRHGLEEKGRQKVLGCISIQRPRINNYTRKTSNQASIADVGKVVPGNLPLNQLVVLDKEDLAHQAFSRGPLSKDLNVRDRSARDSPQHIQSSNSNLPSFVPGIRNAQPRSTNVDTKLCWDWKSGKCSRGERCRFSHVDPLNVERTANQAQEIQIRREQDAKVVERYPILDSSLVSFGAGLNILKIVAGFDLCTMRVKNLPMDARTEEIEDIFLQQGISKSDFFVRQVKVELDKREATVLISSEYGTTLTPGLEGIPFRNEYLSFTLDNNTIGTSMDTTTHSAPFVIVSWKIPSDTIVAGYHSMEQAQTMSQKLNMTTWKGRQIRAVMNERPQGVAGLRSFNPASVKLMNLPITGSVPPDFHQFTGTMDHKLLKSSSFNIEESHARIKELLGELPGVLKHSYEVINVGTTDTSGEAKVKVHFEEWEDAKNAHTTISELECGLHKPTFKPWLPPKPLRYTIKIPAQQYEA